MRWALARRVTISAGLGYTSPIWAGAAITVAALLVMLAAAAAAKRKGIATAKTTPDVEREPQVRPCPDDVHGKVKARRGTV